jgi:hypothetical protein
MRVPTAVAQPLPIKLSFASKISTAALVVKTLRLALIAASLVKTLPLAPSSKADLIFDVPMKTPLAS